MSCIVIVEFRCVAGKAIDFSEYREKDGTAELIAPMLMEEPTFSFLNLTDA